MSIDSLRIIQPSDPGERRTCDRHFSKQEIAHTGTHILERVAALNISYTHSQYRRGLTRTRAHKRTQLCRPFRTHTQTHRQSLECVIHIESRRDVVSVCVCVHFTPLSHRIDLKPYNIHTYTPTHTSAQPTDRPNPTERHRPHSCGLHD